MARKSSAILLAAVLLAAVFFLSLGNRGSGRFEDPSFRYDIGSFTETGQAAYRELDAISLGEEIPAGVAVSEEGMIYVTVGSSLLLLDGEGRRIGEQQLPAPAGAVALGTLGEVYLAFGDHIEALLPGGEVQSWPSLGERAVITSLAADGGAIYAADAGGRIVWRFDREGRLLGSFGRRELAAGRIGFVVPSPYFDLALGPKGDLWVANPGRLRIERYTLDGRLLESWGKASLALDGFGGCCNPSHFTILPDGSFVTSEKGIPRVKVYRADGKLESLVAGPEAFRAGTVGLDLAVDAAGGILIVDPARRQLRFFRRLEQAVKGEGGA